MKKEDLIKYEELTDKIEEQSMSLYKIMKDEFPEQFNTFIIDNTPYLDYFEVEGNSISIVFQESTGDWGEKYYLTLNLEDFLDLSKFEKIQVTKRKKYLEEQTEKRKEYEAFKEKEEKRKYEELKKKYEA